MENEAITLVYDLKDLPSPQHKAGVAGLVLAFEGMERRRGRGTLPEGTIAQEGSAVEISLTEEIHDNLWRHRYDGRSFSPGEYEKRDAARSVDDCISAGASVDSWGEAIDRTLRYVPKARDIYSPGERSPTSSPLVREATRRGKKHLVLDEGGSVGLTGSISIGKMQRNEENVPVKEMKCLAFALHFWPYASVPLRFADNRWVWVIPEVANIPGFLRSFRSFLAHWGSEINRLGKYGSSFLATPREAGLWVMHRMMFPSGEYGEERHGALASVEVHEFKDSKRSNVMVKSKRTPNSRCANHLLSPVFHRCHVVECGI